MKGKRPNIQNFTPLVLYGTCGVVYNIRVTKPIENWQGRPSAGGSHGKRQTENHLCLYQLRRDQPALAGPLSFLRRMEYHDEDVVAEPVKSSSGRVSAAPRAVGQTSLKALKLKNVSTTEEKSRIVTGIGELDRVLGGGIVLGSMILIGGL